PAREYFAYKKKLIPDVMKAYETLAAENDIIVIEGAGSPAEINLKNDDCFVNMGMARLAKAPVLLAGDIDRGGVFAQLYGTIALLDPDEREMVKGMIINKFRGDKTILDPGTRMLEEMTGIPVVGVTPYLSIQVDDEDSLSTRLTEKRSADLIDLAVIRLPRISNFTDFNPLENIPGVSLRYCSRVSDLGTPDLIILPGTKNTMGDLKWLRESGLEAQIRKLAAAGTIIFGICGGYQMLGEEIFDPVGAEENGSMKGIGLLPMKTVFAEEKSRTRVSGCFRKVPGVLSGLSGMPVEGYEIHMGQSEPAAAGKSEKAAALTDIVNRNASDGEVHADGLQTDSVYGTYVHGIFENTETRNGLIRALAERKGISEEDLSTVSYEEFKNSQYDILADALRTHMDIPAVYSILDAGV
ncbi:MAG: cobyric acid synthase, partial [Eubacterium sp.]|nr:cobyric acid synthase [Eubacterium sp.]